MIQLSDRDNVLTSQEAKNSLAKALEVAFAGGSVMGLAVVGLGVIGLSVLYIIYSGMGWTPTRVIQVVTGFSFGASSIALFARGGRGIYTKPADVGAA